MALIPGRERHRTNASKNPLAILGEEGDGSPLLPIPGLHVGRGRVRASAQQIRLVSAYGYRRIGRGFLLAFGAARNQSGGSRHPTGGQCADHSAARRATKERVTIQENGGSGALCAACKCPAKWIPKKVDATFADGVLTITLAKYPEARARTKKINVRTV